MKSFHNPFWAGKPSNWGGAHTRACRKHRADEPPRRERGGTAVRACRNHEGDKAPCSTETAEIASGLDGPRGHPLQLQLMLRFFNSSALSPDF